MTLEEQNTPADQRTSSSFEAEALPHMDQLFRAAVRLTRDRSRAGDAVQETFLIAWKTFDRYESGTNCRAWLFQILFNVVRHERRNWRRWLTGKDEDLSEAQVAAPVTIPDALTDGDILAAIDNLAADFRQVLLLVDVEEFSYKEAGEILRIPIGTVMSRLNRARGHLRRQLSEVASSYGIVSRSRSAAQNAAT
jgi:RNA polymerase sigma-70 factor (ECF subfamily)